ncbi:MAG: glycosyltransferase family 9 protein [Odoribacter sp.]|nr:glycosyltransferase family 9 protein [Odoribacter sp.]
MKKINTIIIRTPNFIGDTINITPCLQLVKHEYPEARIVIVCPDSVADVFKYDAAINKCITFPIAKRNQFSTYWHIFQKTRKEKGDLGINFINTFISAFIFKLAGIKYNIGYNHEGRGFLLDFKLRINRNKHYINRYASLFNEFTGNKYKTLPELYLPISGKKTFDFGNAQKNIGFYPGGTHKGDRRDPEEHAIQLIRLLHQKGYNVVLIGDKHDNVQQAEYVENAHCEQVINLTGQTDMEGFFNTISHLDLLITIDSAAMHAAAALKVPFIALMGLSTSPTSTIVPKVDFGKILKVENNLIREEDYMRNITPAMIVDAMHQLL